MTAVFALLLAGCSGASVGETGTRRAPAAVPADSVLPDAVPPAVPSVESSAPSVDDAPDASVVVATGVDLQPLVSRLGRAFRDVTGHDVTVVTYGADDSVQRVADGEVDVATLVRHKIGIAVERDVVFHAVGWDALVVVVHPDNPIDAITSDDLARVLVGRVTNWEELGGFDEFIRWYAHADRVSGVGRMARELLFSDATLVEHIGTELGTGESLVRRVAADPEGVALASRLGAARHAVKLVAIDGTMPTRANMRVAGYPLMMPFYLVVRRDAGGPAQGFLEFCRGAGQQSIALEGGVGLADGRALWAPYRHRMRAAHVRIGR